MNRKPRCIWWAVVTNMNLPRISYVEGACTTKQVVRLDTMPRSTSSGAESQITKVFKVNFYGRGPGMGWAVVAEKGRSGLQNMSDRRMGVVGGCLRQASEEPLQRKLM